MAPEASRGVDGGVDLHEEDSLPPAPAREREGEAQGALADAPLPRENEEPSLEELVKEPGRSLTRRQRSVRYRP
jgi:hypothetical protein